MKKTVARAKFVLGYTKNSIRDASTPQSGEIVMDTITQNLTVIVMQRYRSSNTYDRQDICKNNVSQQNNSLVN